MHILDARPEIVKKLKEKGLVVRIEEDHIIAKATNSRGGGLIEPQIMKQWWVDVKKKFAVHDSKIEGIKSGGEYSLQEILQHVVRSKQIKILPERFEKQYFNWVDNLLDWCLSRQLWYGHRVPAWYRDDEVYVGVEEPEGEGWEQDPDTLDTWFSAGMFSFTPLGGVDEETEDLKTYHPLSVLETGYDILTFWVVRMILMTAYVRREVPFHTVYLHGLVRDEQGRKMSKSLDNIIDPLDVSEKFGTDAVRLSLIIGSSPGNDSRLSEEKIGGFRNFANKLWNICRFSLLTIDEIDFSQNTKPWTLSDRWILSRFDRLVKDVTNDLENYHFSQAGEKLRDFSWNDLADWYLEIAKKEKNKEKDSVLSHVILNLLKLWHPFMPFVTEALWQEIGVPVEKTNLLIASRWPDIGGGAWINEQVEKDFEIIRNVIISIRSLRAEKNIEPKKKLALYIKSGEHDALLKENEHVILHLANLESVVYTKDTPNNTVPFVVEGVEGCLDLAGAVDPKKERERLQKEIDNVAPYVVSLEKKLGGEFAKKAPKAVVEAEEKKLAEAKEKLEKLEEQMKNL
jgi:valyl-tRNA synthetase